MDTPGSSTCIWYSYSDTVHVGAAVPQGTVIGPIFTYFYSIIITQYSVSFDVWLFADDRLFYRLEEDYS